MQIGLDDLIVGVLYGTPSDLNQHYRVINRSYPVIAGQDFWHRLTGSPDFYDHLIAAFGEVAIEADGVELLESVIRELADEIRNNGI